MVGVLSRNRESCLEARIRKYCKGWAVNLRVRLVATSLMVHQTQSGRKTHGYRGRPSVHQCHPSIDFLRLRCLYVACNSDNIYSAVSFARVS